MAHAAAEVLQLEGRVLLSTTTLTPTADAYTRDGTYANTNYGSATDLAVKYSSISGQGYNRNAFFTFNLSGVSSVGEAVLTLYGAVSDSSTLTIGALPVVHHDVGPEHDHLEQPARRRGPASPRP